MSRNQHLDILAELIELASEIVGDIKQQLIYHRASVYKTETARALDKRVEDLRTVVAILSLCYPAMLEPYGDYDVLAANQQLVLARYPGECTATVRVSRLIHEIARELGLFAQQLKDRGQGLVQEFAAEMNTRQTDILKDILNVCTHGSRSSGFFGRLIS